MQVSISLNDDNDKVMYRHVCMYVFSNLHVLLASKTILFNLINTGLYTIKLITFCTVHAISLHSTVELIADDKVNIDRADTGLIAVYSTASQWLVTRQQDETTRFWWVLWRVIRQDTYYSTDVSETRRIARTPERMTARLTHTRLKTRHVSRDVPQQMTEKFFPCFDKLETRKTCAMHSL